MGISEGKIKVAKYWVWSFDVKNEPFRIYGIKNYYFPLKEKGVMPWSGDSLDEARRECKLANAKRKVTIENPNQEFLWRPKP